MRANHKVGLGLMQLHFSAGVIFSNLLLVRQLGDGQSEGFVYELRFLGPLESFCLEVSPDICVLLWCVDVLPGAGELIRRSRGNDFGMSSQSTERKLALGY